MIATRALEPASMHAHLNCAPAGELMRRDSLTQASRYLLASRAFCGEPEMCDRKVRVILGQGVAWQGEQTLCAGCCWHPAEGHQLHPWGPSQGLVLMLRARTHVWNQAFRQGHQPHPQRTLVSCGPCAAITSACSSLMRAATSGICVADHGKCEKILEAEVCTQPPRRYPSCKLVTRAVLTKAYIMLLSQDAPATRRRPGR